MVDPSGQGRLDFPILMVFPAYHKMSSAFKLGISRDKLPDVLDMAKFVQSHVDIKVELKEIYFSKDSE